MATQFQKIILQGSSKERGVQYGKAAADKIKVSVELYKALFKAYANLSWEECKKRAAAFVPFI